MLARWREQDRQRAKRHRRSRGAGAASRPTADPGHPLGAARVAERAAARAAALAALEPPPADLSELCAAGEAPIWGALYGG